MDKQAGDPGEQDATDLLDGLTELSPVGLRARALAALRQRRFDLADELIARSDLGPEALVENLRIYQAELEIQNEELVRSQREIQEGLARFTSFFNTLPIAELVIDRRGLVMEANLAAQRLFRLQNAHFRQHFFARLIDERDRAIVIDAWGGLGDEQSLVLSEVRFNCQEDGCFIADLHIAPLPPGPHGPQFVCGVVDRTDAVRQRTVLFETSEQLRQNQAALQARLNELATLHTILMRTSQPNAPVRQVLQSVVELLPKGMRDAGLAEARIRLPEVSASTPGFVETEWSLSVPIPLSGVRVGDVTLAYRHCPEAGDEAPFLDEEIQFLDSVATQLSVYLTRVHEEGQLRQSRERYRVLAEFSSDWDFWLGTEGRYLYVSPACQRITGHAADDFLSDASLMGRLVQPIDRPLWDMHMETLESRPETEAGSLELRILARDDVEHWIEHVCNPVLSEDGRFLGRRGVNRDITQRKRFEEELRRGQDFLKATGRLAKVGGWELDPGTLSLRWTQGALALLGLSVEEPHALADLLALLDPKDREGLASAIERALGQGGGFDMETRLTAEGSDPVWVQITCSPALEGGRVVKLLGAIQDISARVEAEKSLRQAARVFESTAEAVVITDQDDLILAVNRAFSEITGYSEAEVLGVAPKILRSGRHDQDFYDGIHQSLCETGQWRGEIWNRRKDGHVFPALLTISAVTDSADEVTHYVGVFSDISQLKQSEERLEFLAHHDPLTGLPNRSLFQQRLEQCLHRAKRYERRFALLFLDLDRFKEVNDTLGHAVGDALLLAVAELLSQQVREVDTIARLGGDEFVILLEDIPAPRFAATFADRLMEVFRRPCVVMGQEILVTLSMGISIYPDDGADTETLVCHADVAMYETKSAGRNGFRFFEKAMSEGAQKRRRLESALRLAIRQAELLLHYQPQIILEDGRLRGVEVLCRWMHPELGLIAPSVFIPLAEEVGLIDELGLWVLEQSCLQLQLWDRGGFHVPRLAVNLSFREILRPGLVSRVQSVLRTVGLEPERLEIEVAESKIMGRAEEAIDVLRALRTLGVTLAVDDFGTGFSSLSYLKRLPLSRLKIDASFTHQLTRDPNDDAIVRAIIALARSMGLEVLAEGVETRAQAAFLLAAGCVEGQGYLLSRPVGAEDLSARWSGGIWTPPELA